MPGLSDAPLAWRLANFDLNIVDAVKIQQCLTGFVDKSIPLTLSKARKIQSKNGARLNNTDLINPAKLQG